MNKLSEQLKRPPVMALLLAAATFVLFAPALGFGFVNYDDDLFVFNNPHVLSGSLFSSLTYAFTSTVGGSWMPLTWLSYRLDALLFGGRVAGFHLTNICLHAAAVACLFLALQRMTGSFWRSALVTAMFGWHPLRAESVVWIAERKDVLSTLCWMLGLLAYARYVEKPGARRYAWLCLWLLLGLMAKPMVVTFPFALLLLDLWPLGRAGRNWMELRARLPALLREKIPLLLLGIGMAGVTYWTQQHTGMLTQVTTAPPLKVLRVAENYGFYLCKIFWPTNLSILYHPVAVMIWRATVTALLLTGLSVLALRWVFRFSWFATGWFWFLGTLVPVIGLIRIGQITVADRYTYLPSVGVLIAVAWALGWFVDKWPKRRPFVSAIALLALSACALVTGAGLPRWQSSITLFEAAIRVGDDETAYNNLAVAYNERGDYDAVIRVTTKAIALYPGVADAYTSRGLAYNSKGELDPAIADFTEAIRLKPDQADSYNNRGAVHMGKKEFELAVRDFSSALQIDPQHFRAWNNRGYARLELGEVDQAIADCTRAIELNPRMDEAYNNRGIAWAKKGEAGKALADYTSAIQLYSRQASYYINRAAMFFNVTDYARAKADLDMCRQLGGQPPAGLVEGVEAGLKTARPRQ